MPSPDDGQRSVVFVEVRPGRAAFTEGRGKKNADPRERDRHRVRRGAPVSLSTKKLITASAGKYPGFRVFLGSRLPIPDCGTVACGDPRHRLQWRVRDGFAPSSLLRAPVARDVRELAVK